MTAQSAASPKRKSGAGRPTRAYGSWGRYPATTHISVDKPAWNDQIASVLASASDASVLPYGMGRSYGDSCLNADRSLIDCRRLDRILGFDESIGILRCESGVTFADIIRVFLPKGWFLPVTPGTQFVTVGGAIANDVHGKNHHRAGTFGANVRQFGLHRSDHGLVVCNPELNSDMFRATIGGLGLTGLIAWADVQLRRVNGPWIDAESIPFHSLSAFLDLSRESDGRFEYTVAWLDCFAGKTPRGIFFRGNHSAAAGKAFHPKRGPQLPFALPTWLLNRYSVKAFNSTYYRMHAKKRHHRLFLTIRSSIRSTPFVNGTCSTANKAFCNISA